jgi:hypothetical protein
MWKGGSEVVVLREHRSTWLGCQQRPLLDARLLLPRFRGIGTMARHAVLGCGLVEEHRLGVNNFGQFVTICAFDVLMGAPQGEGGPLVVIEEGGLPFCAVVAVGTGGSVPFGDELLSVDVLVAVLAQHRGDLEIHIHHLRFKVWRFVAVDTGRGPVCSKQGELSLGMVESGEFLP